MTDEKRAAFWAAVSVLAGAVVFTLNRLYGPIVVYSVFLAPGNLVMGLFTEEINFWPKLTMLLGFQFLVCFAAIYAVIKLARRLMTR